MPTPPCRTGARVWEHRGDGRRRATAVAPHLAPLRGPEAVLVDAEEARVGRDDGGDEDRRPRELGRQHRAVAAPPHAVEHVGGRHDGIGVDARARLVDEGLGGDRTAHAPRAHAAVPLARRVQLAVQREAERPRVRGDGLEDLVRDALLHAEDIDVVAEGHKGREHAGDGVHVPLQVEVEERVDGAHVPRARPDAHLAKGHLWWRGDARIYRAGAVCRWCIGGGERGERGHGRSPSR